MSHSNAVTDRYGIKFKWYPTCLANGLFDDFGYLIQVHVARHYFTEAVGDSDERLVYVLIVEAAGAKQPSVGGSLKTFFNRVASHIFLLQEQLAKNRLF
jgi:hypothetical protein